MTANIIGSFPQSPGNVFQGQPADITLDMHNDVYNAEGNQKRVELSGYWLALTTANSTPGAKVRVAFDQQQTPVEMVPGQVYYLPFQYFTLVNADEYAYGAVSFKVGRAAGTYYSENSAVIPSTPNNYSPTFSQSSQIAGATTAENEPPANTAPKFFFSLVGKKGFRVFLESDNNETFTGADYRFWWGQLNPITNTVIWYPGAITDSFLCSPATEVTVSPDYEIAVPHGYVWCQVINAQGVTSDFNVTIQGA